MLIQDKCTHEIESKPIFPRILTLNSAGDAIGWISYERSAYYAARDRILWSAGSHEIVLRGGTNAQTGMQSILKIDTIIALANSHKSSKNRRAVPMLTNTSLFARDLHMCAYCGQTFKQSILTRDHVIPTSKGGLDRWDNVVTSCGHCNNKKDNRTPEQANMALLYVPYVPSFYESLILQNRHILADQMDFLMKGVSSGSRVAPLSS